MLIKIIQFQSLLSILLENCTDGWCLYNKLATRITGNYQRITTQTHIYEYNLKKKNQVIISEIAQQILVMERSEFMVVV